MFQEAMNEESPLEFFPRLFQKVPTPYPALVLFQERIVQN
jgi:hypothetical protein